MSRKAEALLEHWQASARRRRIAIAAAFAAPWLGVLLWRVLQAGAGGWRVAFALAFALAAALAWRWSRRVDARWLARRLDARRPDMEDSAALLFVRDVGPLQALQRERLRDRIATAAPTEWRDPWPRRALALSSFVALLVLAGWLAWPAARHATTLAARAPAAMHAMLPPLPQLLSTQLRIQPPAYTGLPQRTQAELDAAAPEGAVLRWTLRFAPQPESATLHFHDGRKLVLRRHGEDWTGELRLARSVLYRVALPTPLPKAQGVLHRLDAIPDRPPVLRALAPAATLVLHARGQRRWPLRFEAEDDHGLAARAQLRLIQVQGSGEQTTSRERSLVLQGSGDKRHRHWSHVVDLEALEMAPGDDVIAQLVVSDNRAPRPQRTRSPSFILRWPPEQGAASSGMEGLLGTRLPAYLRSQRQIIIDAEALLERKPKLAATQFAARSAALGGDQQALRMRYGDFLGDEAEGAPPPTNDLPTSDLPTSDEPTNEGSVDNLPSSAAPGSTPDVLAQFGHAHDSAMATALDPDTRDILRGALRQMWESELHLRQGDPAAALPYAYQALAYIKQVQQADRIYLARTGIEVPPIDFTRRLGGKRDGLGDRDDPLLAANRPEPVPARAWQALQDGPQAPRVDLDALERWIRGRQVPGADPLAAIAAIDALRQDPACAACRATLRATLWPLLPRPPAAAGTRARADAAGAAYLKALEGEAAR